MLRANLLALEDDIGDGKYDDRRRDEAGQLRPDQDEALRGRQRRPERAALLDQLDDRPDAERPGLRL